MHKVGFFGVFMMYTYTQAKSSPECHPHAILGKEEEICLRDLLLFNTSKEPDCKRMWDHLNCWPHATAGDMVSQPCPDFFNSEGKVSRNCTVKGWSDLQLPHEDACGFTFNEMFQSPPESPDHMYFYYVKAMYTVGYALSLISLTIAVAILCMFRKLHCTRNYIHIQLFVSFILRAIFIFVRDSLLFADEEFYHCDHYPVACKVVLLFTNYSILANYSWLLAEGHFLYTLVSRSFFSLRKYLAWYVVLAWGTPLIVIISWGCAKYFYEDEGCWETRRHEWIWWILRVPVLPFIFMNLVFFIGILRILVGKLRQSDGPRNEFSQYKRLIKSTFFLVALFGLHYILFGFLPVKLNGLVFKIWNFAELALSSTQGFVVAVLYCFTNGEVQHEIQRRWRRWRLRQNLPHHRSPRNYHGSISQSGSALTQVTTSLLLPCTPPPPPPPSPPPPPLGAPPAASQRPLDRPHVTQLL